MDVIEIIEQFNKGDKEALNTLYDNVARQIFSYGYIITKNSFDAEIVLQDTMIEISKSAYKYDHREKPIVWMLTIAGKCASNMVKNGEVQNSINTPEYLEILNDNSEALSNEILAVLKDFSLEERQILILKSFEALTDKDISKITGIPKMFINKKYTKANVSDDVKKLRVPSKEAIISKCTSPNTEKYEQMQKTRCVCKKVTVAVVALIALVGVCCVPGLIRKNMAYSEALQYFEENGLVGDGFSKDDVILTYNDINSGKFELDITEKVVEASVVCAGAEGKMIILPEDVTAKEAFNLLNNNEYSDKEDIKYVCKDDIRNNSRYNSIFEKYENDELVWSITFSDFAFNSVGGYKEWNDYLVVYGQTEKLTEDSAVDVYVVLVDLDGNVLWRKRINDEYNDELGDIVLNKDTISVFTQAADSYLHYTEIDVEGNVISSNIDYFTNAYVNSAAAYEDGYVVLSSQKNLDRFVFTNKIGMGTNTIEFEDKEEEEYELQAVLKYDGKLYVSGYTEEEMEKVDIEMEPFKPLRDKGEIEILTKAYRKKYCAKLWIYEEELNKLVEVYSVTGAKGDRLSIDSDSNLVWSVEGIDEYTYLGGSGVTYNGSGRMYKYVINEEGDLLKKIRTDNLTEFYN